MLSDADTFLDRADKFAPPLIVRHNSPAHRYPSFGEAAVGHQQDDWDEIGCDLSCALESRYAM